MSPDRLRFGAVTRPEARAVRHLEDLGYDSLWCGGHIASPNASPEPMAQLARLSALAERAVVGTSVVALPLYPPAVIAKQCADLDSGTGGGRLILGVGVGGEYPAEFRACQVPVAERGSRANESIELLRRFWTGQPVSFSGRHYQVDDVSLRPAPPVSPPVVVAGRKTPAMHRAARLGDGWMPYLYSPRRYADSVETITALAADGGRDLSAFHWCVFVFANVHADGDAAREETTEFLGGNYRQDFRAMLGSVAAAGTVPEVRARFQEFADAGARHFIITPASRTRAADIAETIAREVTPSIVAPSQSLLPSRRNTQHAHQGRHHDQGPGRVGNRRTGPGPADR